MSLIPEETSQACQLTKGRLMSLSHVHLTGCRDRSPGLFPIGLGSAGGQKSAEALVSLQAFFLSIFGAEQP